MIIDKKGTGNDNNTGKQSNINEAREMMMKLNETFRQQSVRQPSTEVESYNIYPKVHKAHHHDINFTKMPIFIFVVGNGLNVHGYEYLFHRLTKESEVIVYVIDPVPTSTKKALEGFLEKLEDVESNIKRYFEISKTSEQFFFGGHDIGATIALNSIYPNNYNSRLHSITMHNLKYPINGLICFDPVDGHSSHPNDYSSTTKYDPDARTLYATSHGEENPIPLVIFATNTLNSGIAPEYGGFRFFKAIACPRRTLPNSENSKLPLLANKYCFISEDSYHHLDYIDPTTDLYRSMIGKGWSIELQEKHLENFHKFLIAKITSFIFDKHFNTTVHGDIKLLIPRDCEYEDEEDEVDEDSKRDGKYSEDWKN